MDIKADFIFYLVQLMQFINNIRLFEKFSLKKFHRFNMIEFMTHYEYSEF